MTYGIPYFGKDTNKIREELMTTPCKAKRNYESLFSLVEHECYGKKLVIIDDTWLTWLDDIVFNYRDKECYIPYFTYEVYYPRDREYRSDNKGHLEIKDSKIGVRYNYKLEKIQIKNSVNLDLYNLDSKQKYQVTTNKWFDTDYFSIEDLYNRYIDSSFFEDDYLINKHTGGYHYISKSVKGYTDKERQLRKRYDLETYDYRQSYEKNYRDTRNYKYNEIITKVGIRNTLETYRTRRLRFESMLYCLLRQHSKPTDRQFLKDWEQLGKTKEYIKYGETVKLIFKSYWLDEYKEIEFKSWSRI